MKNDDNVVPSYCGYPKRRSLQVFNNRKALSSVYFFPQIYSIF